MNVEMEVQSVLFNLSQKKNNTRYFIHNIYTRGIRNVFHKTLTIK